MKGSGTVNTLKAYDYFTNAAKYAEVESDPEGVHIYNELDEVGTTITKQLNLLLLNHFHGPPLLLM